MLFPIIFLIKCPGKSIQILLLLDLQGSHNMWPISPIVFMRDFLRIYYSYFLLFKMLNLFLFLLFFHFYIWTFSNQFPSDINSGKCKIFPLIFIAIYNQLKNNWKSRKSWININSHPHFLKFFFGSIIDYYFFPNT